MHFSWEKPQTSLIKSDMFRLSWAIIKESHKIHWEASKMQHGMQQKIVRTADVKAI
jgi:hypothetical protein